MASSAAASGSRSVSVSGSASIGSGSHPGSPKIPRVGGVRCYWALVVPTWLPRRGIAQNPSPGGTALPTPGPSPASAQGRNGLATATDVPAPGGSQRHALSVDTSLANSLSAPAAGPGSSASVSPTTLAGPNGDKKLELQFLHMDPVLSSHLARQKMSMVGRGVIEFIHPVEREQARRDLASAIANDDLQGSVTRVRFARLSRIRIILGAPPEDTEMPEHVERIVEDDEFLVLDLVLNWVADGLLLAFFHAIRDIDPVANNDPKRIHEGWSNFCGTASMPEDQIQAMHDCIAARFPVPSPTRLPPTRVFQLHTTELASDLPGQVVFSWPPARPPGVVGRFDGLYDAAEYNDLIKGVNMDPSQLPALGPGETRTTCTTRFGAKHSITSEGLYRHVESVFIPYGTLIFACFQTTKLFELATPRLSQPAPPVGLQAQEAVYRQAADSASRKGDGITGYNGASTEYDRDSYGLMAGSSQRSSDFEVSSARHERAYPPTLSEGDYPSRAPQAIPDPRVLERPHGMSPSVPQGHYGAGPGHLAEYPDPSYSVPPQVSPHIGSHGYRPTDYPAPPSALPGPSYTPGGYPKPILPPGESDSHPYPTPRPSHDTHSNDMYDYSDQRTPSDYSPSYQGGGGGSHHGSQRSSHMRHNSHHGSPSGSGVGAEYPSDRALGSQSALLGRPPALERSLRPLVRPPGNVECCRICGTTESPEWRRSEAGIKDLCNACGLRLARQVAKRDGKQRPRKKKDK